MSYWQDKVVLITGGSAGLGRTLAAAFVTAGAKVVLAARDTRRVEETARQLASEGGQVQSIVADITDQLQVEQMLARTLDYFGRLDVLVNNAGRSSRGRVLETTPQEFRDLWELNFLAQTRCTAAAAPQLRKTRGHIINIASLAAKSASRYLGAYPSSKSPLAAYSQQLRLEFEPQGVHVLLVCTSPLARPDAGRRYQEQAAGLPDSATRPGGGVKLRGLAPDRLAAQILRAAERRRAELVVPGRARLLFAILQLWPRFGDWIVNKMT